MTEIAVVGGCYRETCLVPAVDEIYGSGGRAAVALAVAGSPIEWHYYCPDNWQHRVQETLNFDNLAHYPVTSEQFVSFKYFHPLARPTFSPRNISRQPTFNVCAEAILQFGFMEGEAKVEAHRCVYDPQSPEWPVPFSRSGSSADELAIVLNSKEVLAYAEESMEHNAVKKISVEDGAKVVLVKDGVNGCRVYEEGNLLSQVPPYKSKTVYKVGSGDQFSTTFFNEWALLGTDALEAADRASRTVARYCETRIPRVTLDARATNLDPAVCSERGRIYIAGPFFTISELWLVEEIFNSLLELGLRPFSPYHHVGIGRPKDVVSQDLDGLENCSAVVAAIDGCDAGTLFEIGYAVKKGIPVVALSQNPKKADLTMLSGSELCTITDDFATAIYSAAWAAMR